MYVAKATQENCSFNKREIEIFEIKNWNLDAIKKEIYDRDLNKTYYPALNFSDYPEVQKVGSYTRNYCLYDTFFPFPYQGKWYALYSPDYTATRIMSLPECKDIGGEEPNSFGFCPVEFFVPYLDPYLIEFNESQVDFGFVSGCVWGDDTNWKLRYINLSEIEQGKISVEERFGYIELPYNQNIREAVMLSRFEYGKIVVNTPMTFDMKDPKRVKVEGYGIWDYKNVDEV